MDKKEFKFGDSAIITGPETVNMSNMNYFDELEYDCWNLIKQYAAQFGFEIKNIDGDDDDIDFYLAKQVQDKILDIFENAGVTFDTEQKLDDDIGQSIQEM